MTGHLHGTRLDFGNRENLPQGTPCAYCGRPAEGLFAVDNDEGMRSYELCIMCGAFPTPSYAELVHAAELRPPNELKQYIRSEFALHGCDCCGVKRRLPMPSFLFAMRGGPYPGVWRFEDLQVCETCNRLPLAQLVCQVLFNVDRALPVSGVIVNQSNPGWVRPQVSQGIATEPPPTDVNLKPSDVNGFTSKVSKIQTLFAKVADDD